MTSSTPLDFSLCLCTFRRPAMLDRLLGELAAYDYGGLRGELIVVDNDPNGSGLPIVETWRGRLPLPVRALRAHPPNIALARNAGIAAAAGRWLLILDDDEWPDAGWIQALIAAQARHGAQAVFGPVMPRYADDVPGWIRKGNFFGPRRHQSGDIVRSNQTYTSNVLIQRSALAGIPGPFDPEYGLTGGSDVALFRDMERRGAVLVWSNEAVVYETVPRSRANFPWLLRRAYSGGQIFIRMQTRHPSRTPRLDKAALGAKAAARLLAASGLALVSLPFSRVGTVHWMRKASAQLGQLTGLAGARFDAYDPHAKRRAH